jgi:hypothetical protein
MMLQRTKIFFKRRCNDFLVRSGHLFDDEANVPIVARTRTYAP